MSYGWRRVQSSVLGQNAPFEGPNIEKFQKRWDFRSHHPTSLADLTRRRSGFIDRNELGQLAVKIGRTMTDDDLDAAMLQMDTVCYNYVMIVL